MKKYTVKMVVLIIFITFSTITWSKKLSPDNIKSLQLEYDTSMVVIPEMKIPIGIKVTTTNNKTYTTRGLLNGKLWLLKFNIECTSCNYAFGKIGFDYDPLVLHRGEVYVRASLRKYPEVSCAKIIPLNYETEVKVFASSPYQKSPGESLRMGFISHFNNGKELFASTTSRTPLDFNHYKVSPFGGYFNKGYFRIYDDVEAIKDHHVGIIVTPLTNNYLETEFSFLLDYKNNFFFYANGGSGGSGSDGSSGSSGSDGSTGSCGSDGSNGSNGSDGSNGNDGHDINVYADFYFDTIINEYLLKILVHDQERNYKKRFLVNTNGGKIDIYSEGGNGGEGGDGGCGGDGGDGGDGLMEVVEERVNDSTVVEKIIVHNGGNGADGGDGGDGGQGGDGGDGGNVFIHYTPPAYPYLPLIRVHVDGGTGGGDGDGGSSGSAGSGGNPGGSSGSSGSSGSDGSSGKSGSDGTVTYREAKDITW